MAAVFFGQSSIIYPGRGRPGNPLPRPRHQPGGCQKRFTIPKGFEGDETPSGLPAPAKMDGGSVWSDADKDLALQIAALCDAPPSKKPREPGQRAIVAIARRAQFSTDEAAWTAYRSSMQRFYEWKQVVDAVLATRAKSIPTSSTQPSTQEQHHETHRAEEAARAKQLHAEAQERYRKRQREAAEVRDVGLQADAMTTPAELELVNSDAQACSRDEFVGSEAEWQHYMKSEEQRRAVWAKWMEQRNAMIEGMPAERLYYIAEARGRRREQLLHGASRGETTMCCACRAGKRGSCASCEGQGGMVLYLKLGGDWMHRYNLDTGGAFSGFYQWRFVRVNQETGEFENENLRIDDGWGKVGPMASLNKMLKKMSSWPESDPLPEHPDTDLWQMASENNRVRWEARRLWREAELSAGRDGLTKWERYEKQQRERMPCKHCGSRYCWGGCLHYTH